MATAYNKISAEFHGRRLELRSGENALQSVIELDDPARLALKNLEYLVAILLFIPRPRQILMLGTAAGSLLHFLRHHYPESVITTVDIDLELIEALSSRNLLPAADSRLRYVFDDARHYIAHCQQQFDLILVDIFNGSQSPAWLLQRPANQQLHGLLNDTGAVAYNMLIGSDHLLGHFYKQLRQIYNRQTLILSVEGFENTIAYGFNSQIPLRDMSWYMDLAMARSQVQHIDYLQVLSAIYTTNPSGSGVI